MPYVRDATHDEEGRLVVAGTPLPLRLVAGHALEPGATYVHAFPQVTVLHGSLGVQAGTEVSAAFSIGPARGSLTWSSTSAGSPTCAG